MIYRRWLGDHDNNQGTYRQKNPDISAISWENAAMGAPTGRKSKDPLTMQLAALRQGGITAITLEGQPLLAEIVGTLADDPNQSLDTAALQVVRKAIIALNPHSEQAQALAILLWIDLDRPSGQRGARPNLDKVRRHDVADLVSKALSYLPQYENDHLLPLLAGQLRAMVVDREVAQAEEQEAVA